MFTNEKNAVKKRATGFNDGVNEITVNKNVNYEIVVRMDKKEEENKIFTH